MISIGENFHYFLCHYERYKSRQNFSRPQIIVRNRLNGQSVWGSCISGKINSISKGDWGSVVQNVSERKWSKCMIQKFQEWRQYEEDSGSGMQRLFCRTPSMQGKKPKHFPLNPWSFLPLPYLNPSNSTCICFVYWA